jgi:hypothetical protein
MKFLQRRRIPILAVLLVGAMCIVVFSSSTRYIDFNTQVKPIINKNCISCHGGVKREAGFSLLFRREALQATESGKPAIVPGDADASEMIRRIESDDVEERMPYKHEPLSRSEIDVLRTWIDQGAEWGDHWAYVPVKDQQVPEPTGGFFSFFKGDHAEWIKNDVDRFILDKLQTVDLDPSPAADNATLLRRVSMDLTGLPPTQTVAQQFLASADESAYARLLDSLFSSPHFGERWASMWMDLARYADTKGYERDDGRAIWRYRDWLIRAFNEDKPYDEFLTEQIAGDLLPDATDEQLVATAFHRNTMTNDEGGTDNEEFRTAAVIDRVNTTWEAVLGTSFACVQCHSHPYDPFTHDEYYKFLAFFNNTRDEDTYDDYPLLRHFSDSLQQELQALDNWLQFNTTSERRKEIIQFVKTWHPSINAVIADQFKNSDLSDTKWLALRKNSSARLKSTNLTGSDMIIFRYQGRREGGTVTFHVDSVNGEQLLTFKVPKSNGWQIVGFPIPAKFKQQDLFLRYTNPQMTSFVETGVLFEWFHFTRKFPEANDPGSKWQETYWKLVRAKVPTTPVMLENPDYMRRQTNVFERGNWLVKGDKVDPITPASLNPFPASAPRDRSGLASWLTDKRNPLTARTIVNRVWEQVFGVGLVETVEDMGTQGTSPSHPELLDWLAWKFMNEYDWSMKKLLRLIVTSATYRQDSRATDEMLEKDPYNRYYARMSRVRFSAEQIRDHHLAASGLLEASLFGPSVMPYQPEGIWLSPWNGLDWKESYGRQKYRRALYTYWKRTAPYPSMITFDAPGREVCTSRRLRTNTPLQALVTLNDETYLEMARNFAFEMKTTNRNSIEEMIRWGYRRIMFKPIPADKLKVFTTLYSTSLAKFRSDKDATCEMIGMMNEHNNPETAALVVVANAMLNLDEIITRN